jgi:hypothetical protein
MEKEIISSESIRIFMFVLYTCLYVYLYTSVRYACTYALCSFVVPAAHVVTRIESVRMRVRLIGSAKEKHRARKRYSRVHYSSGNFIIISFEQYKHYNTCNTCAHLHVYLYKGTFSINTTLFKTRNLYGL